MTIIEKNDKVTIKETGSFKKVTRHFKKKPGHFKKNLSHLKKKPGHFKK